MVDEWTPYTVKEGQRSLDDVLPDRGFDRAIHTDGTWTALKNLVWGRPENQATFAGRNPYEVVPGETVLVPSHQPSTVSVGWKPYTIQTTQKTLDDVLPDRGFDRQTFTDGAWDRLKDAVWHRPENQPALSGREKWKVVPGETLLVPERQIRRAPVAPRTDKPNLLRSVEWVTILVAAQKTGEPRENDAEVARTHVPPLTVQQVIAERVQEDKNFLRKATTVEARIKKSGRFEHHTIVVVTPSTGAEFLEMLERFSSAERPIKNLVFWGHSGPYGFYMKSNRAFYRSLKDFEGLSREGGARALDDDLRPKLHTTKTIFFAEDAFIMFCGCKAAGDHSADKWSLASWFTRETGATTIGSVGGSDQSIAPSWDIETSKLYWAIFTKDAPDGRKLTPQELRSANTRDADVLKLLHP